jgi:DNA-binding PadR family transcriptional regulator
MSARLAILGLLVEQPRHGYAIDRVIEERGMRRWSGIGFSSIYWTLDRLVDDGLAEVQEVQLNGRAGGRKVFRATEAGVRAWRDESIAVLGDFERPVEEFLVALSGLPAIDPREARAALERRLAGIDVRLGALQTDRERAGHDVPAHVVEMFAFGQASLEAQRAWLAGLLGTRWQSMAALATTDRATYSQEV